MVVRHSAALLFVVAGSSLLCQAERLAEQVPVGRFVAQLAARLLSELAAAALR